MFRKLRRYLGDPYHEIGYDLMRTHPNWLPDKWYLKLLWEYTYGYELDLEHPKTFNEKLQWLKLYDRKPEYTTMVDKYRVKQWIAEKIGEQYVIPTLAVYNNVDEINLDELPDQFVLKCNHDSGSVVICRDKSTFDLDAAKRKLGAAMKKNYYWLYREWPYKDVQRCIFAEKYLEETEDDMIDYKMMSFNGEVKCSFTCTNRKSGEGLNVTFFDTDWERMPFSRHYPVDVKPIAKPVSYKEMVKIAEKLSEIMPFSRVDFYEIKGMPYFGEITLYPGGGFEEFEPPKWDYTLGEWIELPNSDNVNFVKHRGGVIVNDDYVIRVKGCQNTFVEYKFFCFNGNPRVFQSIYNRQNEGGPVLQHFDINGSRISLKDAHYHSRQDDDIPNILPERFDKMVQISRALSKGLFFLRTDFFETTESLYVGELTFYESGGFVEFNPDRWNYTLGDWIQLHTDA